MRSLIAGSLLAAVAMFIFGMVYWMSPLSSVGIHEPQDNVAAQSILRQTFPKTGLYWVPGMELWAEDAELYERLHVQGPVVMVNIIHDPGPSMAPNVFVSGFIHEWIVCFLIGWILVRAAPAVKTYSDRVAYVALIGFTVALFSEIGAAIWWRMPLSVQLVGFAYTFLAWLIAGLVLARFIRPVAPTPAA